MREVNAVNKRRAILEEVRRMLEPGPGVEGEQAPETADLRNDKGQRVWIWGVSRWGGGAGSRIRGDVFR